jgi:hypothetical protein
MTETQRLGFQVFKLKDLKSCSCEDVLVARLPFAKIPGVLSLSYLT